MSVTPTANTEPFFDSSVVSNIYAVPNHSGTYLADDQNINLKKIPLHSAASVSPEKQIDIESRMKTIAPYYLKDGSILHYSEEPRVGEMVYSRSQERASVIGKLDTEIQEKIVLFDGQPKKFFDAAKIEARRNWEELSTYVDALEQAVNGSKGDNRWIVIIGPNAKVRPDMRDAINRSLVAAPEDAGAIYLGGHCKFEDFGEVLVRSDSPGLIIPTRNYGTAEAVAYRPAMAAALLEALKRNLSISRADGGISPLDHAAANLQAPRVFSFKTKHPELELVRDTFEHALDDKNEQVIYAMNPLPLASDSRGLAELHPVSLETAKELRGNYLKIIDKHGESNVPGAPHTDFRAAVKAYIESGKNPDGAIIDETNLIDTINKIARRPQITQDQVRTP